jgi:uncharacterized phage-associated protein
VAKEFVRLSLAGDEKDPLTNLRLQKLLYYAQAWSLIIRESQLFSDEIQAWRYGPVVPAVYHELPDGQGTNTILPAAFAAVPDLQAEDAEFVRSVWEAYNQYSALKLSGMTYEELPWRKAWGDRPNDGIGTVPISIEDLEEFFGKHEVPGPLAAYCNELRKREEEAARKLREMAPLDVGRLEAAVSSFTPAADRLVASGG